VQLNKFAISILLSLLFSSYFVNYNKDKHEKGECDAQEKINVNINIKRL